MNDSAPQQQAQPRRVLHVEAGRHLYGGAQQVLYLLEGLAARGVDNVLACPEGAEYADRARHHATVVELPMRGDADLALIGRLAALARKHDVDLMHLHSRRGADWLGGLAARRAGLPAILSRRVDNPESRLVCRIKYSLFDRVITISRAIAGVLFAQGVAAERIACVPSAVDATPYLAPPDLDWFRTEFALSSNVPVIAMAAQFIERKGHAVLLDALPAVLASQPAARVLLFGRGPLESTISRRVRQQDLAGSVSLVGFHPNLPRVLPCLDLLVHPASAEGLGVVLLQASAAAVPIVAGRAGGIPEVVIDGQTGSLVEPGNSPALADAVLAMLAHPERARALGAAGRAHVTEAFSIRAMVTGNLAVYCDVMATRRAGTGAN